jgi:integrase
MGPERRSGNRETFVIYVSASCALARKVLVSLKSLLHEAQRRGDVAQNVALSVSIGIDKRTKRKLKVGVDIPTPDEIKRLIEASTRKWRALLITVVFTGLRASELRGLRWEDVDLKGGELHVRQRADRYNKIGAPKSESSERTIPIGPMVLNTLRQWRLDCPKGDLDLVFPTGRARIAKPRAGTASPAHLGLPAKRVRIIGRGSKVCVSKRVTNVNGNETSKFSR